MIEIINRRNNGAECEPIVRHESPEKALYSMVKFELGYGGMIVAASETSITVRTRVLNCVDHTTFSGSQQDMRPLIETAYFFMEACKHDDQSIDQVVEQLAATPSGKGLRTFYLTNLAPLLLGQKRVSVACMLGMGLTNVNDIEFGIRLRFDDLFALLGLIIDAPGRSLQDLASTLDIAPVLV
ncbi:MAG: hypothetical protein P4L53_23785 [Candidatus Obscuribacterales bacterium]|nr:hypothetical protein [Candidatus Obscuribacterales bacterium]